MVGTEWLNESLNDMLCGLKNSYIRRYNKAIPITRLRVHHGLSVSDGHGGNKGLLMGYSLTLITHLATLSHHSCTTFFPLVGKKWCLLM